MPTTSPALAAALLDALVETGISFALLHEADALPSADFKSDIDIVSTDSPYAIIDALVAIAAESGLHLISIVPYEVNSVSSFWCTENAADGVHLDVTFGPRPTGRFSFRSSLVVEGCTRDTRWPTAAPIDGALYTLCKHSVKGNAPGARVALDGMDSFDTDTLAGRVNALFSRPVARHLISSLRGHTDATALASTLHHQIRVPTRLYPRRLLWPVGFWTEIYGKEEAAEAAQEIAKRFDRFLIAAVVVERPDSPLRQAAWWAREIAPRRWRPTLVISVARRRHRPLPDLSLETHLPNTLDNLCSDIIVAMASDSQTLMSQSARQARSTPLVSADHSPDDI